MLTHHVTGLRLRCCPTLLPTVGHQEVPGSAGWTASHGAGLARLLAMPPFLDRNEKPLPYLRIRHAGAHVSSFSTQRWWSKSTGHTAPRAGRITLCSFPISKEHLPRCRGKALVGSLQAPGAQRSLISGFRGRGRHPRAETGRERDGVGSSL